MPAAKTYTGGCHCGGVRYEVQADLSQVIECNCSICTKKGSLLTFVTRDKFKLVSGEASPDGTRMAAINVRCLDGVDLDALKPKKFDGRSL